MHSKCLEVYSRKCKVGIFYYEILQTRQVMENKILAYLTLGFIKC